MSTANLKNGCFDTGGPGKLATVALENAVIKKFFPNDFEGLLLTLPGSGCTDEDGKQNLIRHHGQYYELGYRGRQIVLIERETDPFDRINRLAQTIFDSAQILKNDIITVANDCFKKGIKVSGIDFDGTSALTKETLQLIIDAGKNGVKFFTLVVSTRGHFADAVLFDAAHQRYNGGKKEHTLVEKRDGDRVYFSRTKKPTMPNREIQKFLIKEAADEAGYEIVLCRAYKGQKHGPKFGNPMMSIVMVKKDI